MSMLHIANIFFDLELEANLDRPLEKWLKINPVVAQLQFLPLLYALPSDQILVTDLPENPDPRLITFQEVRKGMKISAWGASQAIEKWALKNGLLAEIFDFDLIRKIHSKLFSHRHSPKLPGSEILENKHEIDLWLKKTKGPKVLKSPFGTSGRGHFFIDVPEIPNVKQLYIPPFIAEPWVKRTLDFSSQWNGSECLGILTFENDRKGSYQKTFPGKIPEWALNEHLSIAKKLVSHIQSLGYSGHLGIDAFIYLDEGKEKLHPVVEINVRKTMSWVALQQPDQTLHFAKQSFGKLPSSTPAWKFRRNIL